MPVKRRATKARKAYEPTPEELAWLYSQPWPEDANPFELLDLEYPDAHRERFGRPTLAELWAQHRDRALARWVRRHPGTRPSPWWLCDAPEPRRRLGGIGDAICSDSPLYDGIAVRRGPPRMVPPDPDDPPTYEGQAAYLVRLGLLMPGERARIPASAFEPVTVP